MSSGILSAVKILHIIASLDPASGGPVEGVLRFGEAIQALGSSRDIVCLDHPEAPWILSSSERVFAVGSRKRSRVDRFIPWRRYGYTSKLIPWLKENACAYDAVIVNGIWNFCAMGAKVAFKKTNVPYFVFTHGMLDPWFRTQYPVKTLAKQISWWLCEGPLLNNAEAVFFTTEEERLLAQGAFWPYRCREQVVGYGTADVRGDPKTQIKTFYAVVPQLKGRPFLLFLSRIHEKKGCDLLIRAFSKLSDIEPDIQLVVAGPDQMRLVPSLKETARRLSVGHRVHWTGMLTGDAKWGALRACEAFVLPSHQENFGIVVAEAMACSKPVLITNKVNIWREVEEGGGGLVANDTEKGIEEIVAFFLSLPQSERKRMGEAARSVFKKHFDINTNAVTLLECLTNRR